MRKIIGRLVIIPFETAIAILLMLSGTAALMHYGVIDPVAVLLPHWEAIFLNVLSILSGFLMIMGMALDEGRVEESGLLFLCGSLISRFLLYGHYLHYKSGFFVTGLFYLTIIIAGAVRIVTIRRKSTIVRIKS